jgi:NAD(P)-dependent dehydrogenase (short-subunit alcohol dehydrogenase family)
VIDLTGNAIIVTGAGGGIGTGIARSFASAGASLLLVTRESSAPALEGKHEVLRADLNDADSPVEVVAAAVSAFGRIDALVNNAGIQPLATLSDITDDDFRTMIETDLVAVHRLSQAVALRMIEQGTGGAIVHIASIEGLQPAPLHGHYAAAKAGLRMHARAAAQEWGHHGIRVNSVSPGLIDRAGIEEDWPEGVARWLKAAPLGRLGTPDDVGNACVFLCSDLASFITGADLVVDGGVLARPTW